MAAHVHAENMMLYAQDAAETDKPWERWQYKFDYDSDWFDMTANPKWGPETDYRRKPRTIKIGDYEVPEPVRTPLKKGQNYFVPLIPPIPSEDCQYSFFKWNGGEIDMHWLKLGIIHIAPENAELHAKAWLSFTKVKERGDE